MKYKMILLFYSVIAPCAVLLRLIQVASSNAYSTEQSKGSLMNYVLWIVIFAAIIGIGFLGSTTFRLPKSLPKVGWMLCGVSVLYAVSCAFIALYADRIYVGNALPSFLLTVMRVFGFASAALFFVYAISEMLPWQLPNLLFVLPIAFGMLRLICAFVSQNDKKQSMDRFLVILLDCLFLLFFVELGKQFNGIDKEYNFRKLLSVGLASSALGFCHTVPCIIAVVLFPAKISDVNLYNVFYVFFTAVFVLVFCLQHFGDGNLGIHHHHHHHHHGKRTPGDDKGTLYTGG